MYYVSCFWHLKVFLHGVKVKGQHLPLQFNNYSFTSCYIDETQYLEGLLFQRRINIIYPKRMSNSENVREEGPRCGESGLFHSEIMQKRIVLDN